MLMARLRCGTWWGHYPRRNVELKRTTNLAGDTRYAMLIPHVLGDDAFREYCRTLDAWQQRTGQSKSPDAAAHLVWCFGMVNPPGHPPRNCSIGAQTAHGGEPKSLWPAIGWALAQHRAGQHAAAQRRSTNRA